MIESVRVSLQSNWRIQAFIISSEGRSSYRLIDEVIHTFVIWSETHAFFVAQNS